MFILNKFIIVIYIVYFVVVAINIIILIIIIMIELNRYAYNKVDPGMWNIIKCN